ncbi:MAG: hypothetical protein HY961_05285 [Ignavibacteriae bacterium]|nr:hypothetical protein [Ignavibacteriota bacterium]
MFTNRQDAAITRRARATLGRRAPRPYCRSNSLSISDSSDYGRGESGMCATPLFGRGESGMCATPLFGRGESGMCATPLFGRGESGMCATPLFVKAFEIVRFVAKTIANVITRDRSRLRFVDMVVPLYV